MTNAPVLIERKGGAAYLTLSRPDAGNAIDVPLARALLDAVVTAEADPEVRCVVLAGKGRMFCAGGDVKALRAAGKELPALLGDILRYLHPAIMRLAHMYKPVITAIQGPSAGAGIALSAVGDIALAEPAAHFTMAYSRIGLSPDGGATWLLPRLIGLRRAQELALTNRRVSAEEAAAMGLITRVVEPGRLPDEVDSLAQEFAKGPTGALGRTKRLLSTGMDASLSAQLDAERDEIVDQASSPESDEGIAAFSERRKADFHRRAI